MKKPFHGFDKMSHVMMDFFRHPMRIDFSGFRIGTVPNSMRGAEWAKKEDLAFLQSRQFDGNVIIDLQFWRQRL